MMNMDIERIVREKCAELGIEYDDSITKALENGEALSEDVTIEMKAMYEGLHRLTRAHSPLSCAMDK